MFFRKRSEAYIASLALIIIVFISIKSTYLYYNKFVKKCRIESPCIFIPLGTELWISKAQERYSFYGFCFDKFFKTLSVTFYNCSYRVEYSLVSTLITVFGLGFVLYSGITGLKVILFDRRNA